MHQQRKNEGWAVRPGGRGGSEETESQSLETEEGGRTKSHEGLAAEEGERRKSLAAEEKRRRKSLEGLATEED